MSQGVSIRRATPADAEALARIGRETFAETFGHLYPPEDLAAFLDEAHGLDRVRGDLEGPETAVWLAIFEGAPVGYVLAGPCALPHPEVRAEDGEIKRLYLSARAQNGGLGGALFDAAMRWLRESARAVVWIGVWSGNHGAQRFYERRGFRRVGGYGFRVGAVVDDEFILRGSSVDFAPDAAERP
jgi:ribosomal protein S18 acetylase RimI-like enzyme